MGITFFKKKKAVADQPAPATEHQTSLNGTGTTPSKSLADLRTEKINLEIQVLKKKLEDLAPRKKNVFERLYGYLQRNVGQFLAIIALLGGIVTPLWTYIGKQRKEQFIQINSAVLQAIDSLKKPTDADILRIATGDPAVTAPIVLHQLNTKRIADSLVRKIYVKMYQLNADFAQYNLTDEILFFFIADNKTILEDELCEQAKTQFEQHAPAAVLNVYVDIIFELQLEKKPDFEALLAWPCERDPKSTLCKYINAKKP